MDTRAIIERADARAAMSKYFAPSPADTAKTVQDIIREAGRAAAARAHVSTSSSPAAAYAPSDSVALAGKRRAKTVKEIVLEADIKL